MRLRVLAVAALLAALVPVWAGELITYDTRINRMRITTVVPEGGGAHLPPRTQDKCQNRMRITTVFDLPGTVRSALPHDRQIDRTRFDALPHPRPTTRREPGRIIEVPEQPKPAPKATKPNKEEVWAEYQEAKPAEAPADSAAMREETIKVKVWQCGRQVTDSRNRRWWLIQGTPQREHPTEMRGWIMQAADSPIYFFSRTGRMYRLMSQPLN